MVDIETYRDSGFRLVKMLNVAYKFRNMPYLVADKFGNFFILPHFNKKRTTEFKQLNTTKGYIYYNRNMVRLSTIRKRVIKVNDKIEINSI